MEKTKKKEETKPKILGLDGINVRRSIVSAGGARIT